MGLPVAGIVQTPLKGQRSGQNPTLGFQDQLTITGSANVKVGTFAPYNHTIKRTVVACLAEVPAAGKAYVYVGDGPTPDQVTVYVRKSDFTASVVATKVNLIVAIGSSVGQ